MRHCPHCGSLFRGAFEHCSVDGTRLLPVGATDPLLHRPIDRYRIEAFLGEGSTGRVYRARHRLRDEACAMKLIWGDLGADQRVVRRFQRAAAATRRIRHPNVVQVTDFGTTIGGLSFVVMELVEGASLKAHLEKVGPLPALQAGRIAMQTARGLAAAHEAGFVHRDVKPANLMLGDDGRVRLLDFGLVGLAVADEDLRITASGTFVGTPMYMAPEQARSASEASPLADVYALGVVLHELLSGKPPFTGSTSIEVMIHHSTRPPPRLPPSGGLEALAAWAMAKDPSARPASAQILARELASVVAQLEAAPEPVLADTLEMEPVPRASSSSS